MTITIGTETKGVSTKPDLWTDYRVSEMKRLYDDGLSFSQIANALDCGISRNSVIGKFHRYFGTHTVRRIPLITAPKKPKPDRTGKNDGGMAYRVVNGIRKRQAAPDDPEPFECAAADVVPLNKTLLDLKEGECRYPYGAGESIVFCGHRVHWRMRGEQLEPSSYCKPHYLICTNPWKGRAG